MFKRLKEKLKSAISSIAGKAKEETKEVPVEEVEPEVLEQEPEVVEEPEAVVEEEPAPVQEPEPEETVEEPEDPKEPEEIIEEPEPVPEEVAEEPEPVPEEVAEEKIEELEQLSEEILDQPEKVEEFFAEEAEDEPEDPKEPEEAIEEPESEQTVEEESAEKVAEEKPPEEKPVPQEPIEEKPKKRGFFTKLTEKFTTIQLSNEKFEEVFWDLELAMLENNVAVEVIERLKEELRDELTTGRTARGEISERIMRRLEETLLAILQAPPVNLLADVKEHRPLIIAMVGINGSGKTTSAAKLTKYFQNNGKTVLLAAADTFRAAAIQQLEEHANNLHVPIIKQDYGADPAAVAYDAVASAKAKNIDVVLIDTAGRLHSNTNLMDELKKVIRVASPHRILFVGEATTGNDCVEQARKFSDMLPVDGIILTKSDVDESGGAAVSAAQVTGKPILFMGTGQSYEDFEPFEAQKIVRQLLG